MDLKLLFKDFNYKLWGSGVIALALSIVLIVLSLTITSDRLQTTITCMVVLLGYAFGWLLGIVLSPYSPEEKENFSVYAKAFGVFASGYLVGKVDKAVERLFDVAVVFDPVNGFRMMAFTSAVLISVIVTFVFRKYG